jgi:hypothetical protein
VPGFTFRHCLNGSPADDAEQLGIRLLGKNQMKTLFPDAKIIVEIAAGWPKSLIAFRRSEQGNP